MEQKKSPIREKSLEFAVRIIKLAQFLRSEKKEFILADQIMRSGTSNGANVEEANWWLTRKEFIQKMSISYREARETKYWLELLLRWWYISQEQHDSLGLDVVEILKILASIITTSKEKNTLHF
jgi:four helix bundle protein